MVSSVFTLMNAFPYYGSVMEKLTAKIVAMKQIVTEHVGFLSLLCYANFNIIVKTQTFVIAIQTTLQKDELGAGLSFF